MFSSSSISKWVSCSLWLSGVLLLSAGHIRAQIVELQPQPQNNDPFVAYHASLNSTADNVLAAPMQRPMKATRNKSSLPAAVTDAPTIQASGPAGAINRVQQLRPIIEPILREERVPTELSAVVLIESGGPPNAPSPQGARARWSSLPRPRRPLGPVVTPRHQVAVAIVAS